MSILTLSPFSRAELTLRAATLELSNADMGDTHCVKVSGELDLVSSPQLEEELERAEASPARYIVFDLSGLEFIDSSGIAVLLAARSRAGTNSNRLMLLRPCPLVFRTLRICGVDSLLPFID